LWHGYGVARILREAGCELADGGPRRKHLNVSQHAQVMKADLCPWLEAPSHP
jgi:hypothetical protein